MEFVPISADCVYLLKKEAANYLRVSPSQFRRLELAGALPEPLKLGSRSLYTRQMLDEHLARQSGQIHNGAGSTVDLDNVKWN